jgi:Tol biopolymer transport system component/tRNA A-37 threonylcarbamoyl transferase component Bud32
VSAPPLSSGANLAHYRIGAKLGEGGMGEVYAAEDTRLGRTVAIKVLPPELARDPERRARFEREAKAVAALNHPNIVTVFAVEELDGQLLMIMEHVPGKTVAQLLPPKGFPLEDFFRIAVPLADAVGAAHQQGITHRDLKPQNVMLTDEGRVKVLDFGLAKLAEHGLSAGEATATATGEGKIVGTVAYMSPEQAQGKKVDHRSDVFSLGVMLYEMVTGKRPFQGDSTVSLLASVLRDQPPAVSEVNPAFPVGVARIIRRCLAKEPAQRYQSAVDLRHDLEDWREESRSGTHSAPAPSIARALGPGRARRLFVVPLAIAGLLGAAVVGKKLAPRGPSAPIASGGPRIDKLQQLTFDEGAALFPSLSPDGTWFVYARRGPKGDLDLYRKRVGGENAQDLTADSDGDDNQPAISPDGERIAFRSERAGGGLFVMGATGESVKRVSDAGYHPSWFPDGKKLAYSTLPVHDPKIIINSLSEGWTVDLENGERKRILERISLQPVVSPHGTRIAFWSSHKGGVRDLATIPAAGGPIEWLTDDLPLDWNPVWSPDGRYLYFSSSRAGNPNLWRMPIDERTGKRSGELEPVSNGAGAWAYSLAFNRDGTRAVFDSGSVRFVLERVPLDAAKETTGRAERLAVGNEPSVFGDQVVFRTTYPEEDLVVMRTDGSARRKLTDDPYRDRLPYWSPDGSEILFKSDRDGSYQCWSIRPDGSHLRKLTQFEGVVNYCMWRDAHHATLNEDGGRSFTFDVERPWKGQTPVVTPTFSDGRAFQPGAWSSDKKSLVGGAVNAIGQQFGVWQLDVASGKLEQLSPDGYQPAFFGGDDRVIFNRDGGIAVVDRKTKKVHMLVTDPGHAVDNFGVSADRRFIYYQREQTDGDVWLATFK